MSDGLSKGTYAVCPVCGVSFRRNQRGQKMCSRRCAGKNCAGKATEYAAVKICVGCGQEYTAEHAKQRYCSVVCRQRTNDSKAKREPLPPIPCAECGKLFVPKTENTKCCSDLCKGRRYWRLQKERLENAKTEPVPCRVRIVKEIGVLPELRPEVGAEYDAERWPETVREPCKYYIRTIGKFGLILYKGEVEEI